MKKLLILSLIASALIACEKNEPIAISNAPIVVVDTGSVAFNHVNHTFVCNPINGSVPIYANEYVDIKIYLTQSDVFNDKPLYEQSGVLTDHNFCGIESGEYWYKSVSSVTVGNNGANCITPYQSETVIAEFDVESNKITTIDIP